MGLIAGINRGMHPIDYLCAAGFSDPENTLSALANSIIPIKSEIDIKAMEEIDNMDISSVVEPEKNNDVESKSSGLMSRRGEK